MTARRMPLRASDAGSPYDIRDDRFCPPPREVRDGPCLPVRLAPLLPSDDLAAKEGVA